MGRHLRVTNMVWVSIKTLSFMIFLWKTCFGQPADYNNLVVTNTSFRQNEKNDSLQNFIINFQLKRAPADDNVDGIENREIKFSILDKIGQQVLEEKSIVFDENPINYDGKFLGLTSWTRSTNINQIQVDGYFDKKANETFFLVEEVMESEQKQRLLRQRIIFDDKIKLNIFMKIFKGKKISKKVDEVNDGSTVTVVCKAYSMKDVEPKFIGLHFNQKIKLIQKKKEIQATFKVEKGIHLKKILCVAGVIERSLTIKVFHAPTAVRIKPAERDTLMAGGRLQCFAMDGHPKPTVTWNITSVPLNGHKFHRINQANSSSTFILKENAPVGSVWSIRCISTNRLGNSSRSVNFTVEANQTTLLFSRLSKLEESQRFQDANIQKLLSQQKSNLETKMKKMMETMVQQHEALKGDLKASREASALLRNEIIQIKKEIVQLSSNTKNDKSEWRNSYQDLRRLLEELKGVTNVSRRMQDNAVGRLDKLAATMSGLNDFVWRIEGISGKVGILTNEYSRPFYSDGTTGYKLCLYFLMWSSKAIFNGLNLQFILMTGDDDDRLQWPMNRTVLIEVIDEQNGIPVMSRRVSRATTIDRIYPNNRMAAYNRPTTDRNSWGDGFVLFQTYEKIKLIAGAIRGDSMTVRCRVLPH